MGKINKKKNWILLGFIIAIGSLTSVYGNSETVGKTYDNLKIFAEVLSMIEKNYVEIVAPDKLINGAINGMLRTLDPHSSYMTVDMYKEMKVETEGEFGGLGIEISIKDDILTIVSPIDGTPAFKSGIQAWDRILKIDGESTRDISLMDAVKKMRGKPGTAVELLILREGKGEPFTVSIVRDIIKIKSVSAEMVDGDVGYIKIRRFSMTTSSELSESIKEIESKQNAGIILDLRNNPGGLLNQAVEVTEKFVWKKDLIVYTKGRLTEQNFRYTSNNNGEYVKKPVIVLVNAGSASASEIVAGALQDLRRAIILGTQTFGKGSVQTIIPMSDGSGLRLTTALYYTPKDRLIQGVGIKPDIIVEQEMKEEKEVEKEDKKPKKQNHLFEIHEKDLENHIVGTGETPKEDNKAKTKEEEAPKPEPVKEQKVSLTKNDKQLERAVGLIKSVSIFKNLSQ